MLNYYSLFIWALVFFVKFDLLEGSNLLRQKIIVDIVNSLNTTWKADINHRFEGLDLNSIRNYMGALLEHKNKFVSLHKNQEDLIKLPESFDAREVWKHCDTLHEVRDQGSCGSCWAVAAAATMSDRYCIHLNLRIQISSQDLLSCCKTCGKGCNGGYSRAAWSYWVNKGVTTGGEYNSNEGCKPYTIPKCDHHVTGQYIPCKEQTVSTPSCSRSCQSSYGVKYWRDKHFGDRFYWISREKNIMSEIYTNGPVEATFCIYEDFFSYKSGVYKHVTGSYLGNHSVKVLGWGIENGTAFWLAANSWNTDWGDEGFFKILRGENEAYIESYAYAGIPKY